MKDFFISYNKADRAWAEWIAWTLEEEKYTTILQAWDFAAGSNFVLEMHEAAKQATRTIAVLSPDYLNARYTQPEWAAAFAKDPTGKQRKLILVRVRDCDAEGLLGQTVYVDLCGLDEATARERLLAGVSGERAKPTTKPTFPRGGRRSILRAPVFPRLPGPAQPHDSDTDRFDVFLSYEHSDAEAVLELATRVKEDGGATVWLDRWQAVPGRNWVQAIARGLRDARCCAVCIGASTPNGWFRQEIEAALNRQAADPSFRVIPVLLPGAERAHVDDFLELRMWVDFRGGIDDPRAFHVLMSGIRDVAPGPDPVGISDVDTAYAAVRAKLFQLQDLRREKLVDESVILECQRKLLLEIWMERR